MEKYSYRILVVDDEPPICQALAFGLASREYVVDCALNGAQAVKMGAEGCYDILIADLNLPDMNGIQVIKAIRARHPNIVSILITAYGTPEMALEARRQGVNQYLIKPFEMREIKECISRELRKRG